MMLGGKSFVAYFTIDSSLVNSSDMIFHIRFLDWLSTNFTWNFLHMNPLGMNFNISDKFLADRTFFFGVLTQVLRQVRSGLSNEIANPARVTFVVMNILHVVLHIANDLFANRALGLFVDPLVVLETEKTFRSKFTLCACELLGASMDLRHVQFEIRHKFTANRALSPSVSCLVLFESLCGFRFEITNVA